MKKSTRNIVSVALLLGVLIVLSIVYFRVSRDIAQPIKQSVVAASDTPTSRRSVIVADGKVLREIAFNNITVTTGGVMTIPNPGSLSSPVTVGTSAAIRENASALELSNDGSTWYSFLDIPYTNATTFSVGIGDTAGTTSINLGDSPAFRYNHTSSKVEYYDGGFWLEVGSGSGSGTDWALTSADHTNTFATYTKTGQFTALDLADFQATTFVYLQDLATAETFFHRTEAEYSCTMQKWGKDAANKLTWTVGTAYAASCVSTTLTSTWTFSAATLNRWVEISLRVDDTGNTLSFYVDGVMVDTQAYAVSLLTQAAVNETIEIYAGVKGKGGPLKFGNSLTWPITANAWKGIDKEGRTYPGLVWYAPLLEGKGTTIEDILSNDTFTLDGDVSWETIEGGL